MRILEFCLSPAFGGLEINMCDLSRWLTQSGRGDVYLGVTRGSRIAAELQALECPTLFSKRPCGKLPFRSAWRLSRWIEQHAIDVVHIHWKFDLPLLALTKRLCRRPFRLVHTRHMNLPGKKHDPYHAWLYRSLDRLIVVTHYLHRQATHHLPMDPRRIVPIHCGVAPGRSISEECLARRCRATGVPLPPRSGFHVGLFGRICDYKGQHLLVDAVEMLRAKGKPIHAWIIGEPFDPEYLAALRQDVARRGLADLVHFLGFQRDPMELMAAFDVVTLTTRNETFGLVLVEAMQVGTAVVGSREGGVPEIIDDGETGLLFETWNAADLARALEQLHDDPSLRRRLALAGQRKAARSFDRDRQFAKVLDVLVGETASGATGDIQRVA